MSVITADKVINQNLFAKTLVSGYDSTLERVRNTFSSGGLIGNVYSYIIDQNGNLYWLIYVTKNDFNNNVATFIKHDPSKLSLPALPGILEAIKKEQDAKAKTDKGMIPFYVEKYAPWIIGAIVIAVAYPTISKSFKK
jgi:hypothetical protein